MIKKSTRNQYLLDLVLCNLDEMKIDKTEQISDHRSIYIQVPDAVELRDMGERKVFHYQHADWEKIRRELDSQD